MEGPFARIVYVTSTASTNDDAAKLLDDDAARGMTIVAEEQTRGTGRKGRAWIAAPGTALLFTTILPVDIPTRDVWCAPFWTALAVRAALSRSGIDTQLQWPNDLLLQGRKLAGILCVSRVFGERTRVACGVGINVFRTQAAAEAILPAPAFCDDVAHVDRQTLLALILEAFSAQLPLLAQSEQTARRWEAEARLPSRYRLQVDGEPLAFEATALGLASGGALLVEDAGERREIALADARVLR